MLAAAVGILAHACPLPDPEHRMGTQKDPRRQCCRVAQRDRLSPSPVRQRHRGRLGFAHTASALSLSVWSFLLRRAFPFIALVLIALVSLILGMGLPTTSAYILGAALGVPALAQLGFDPLAAHMFVFYFAIVSNITPPVALAAYAASSLAQSKPTETAIQALKLGILAFMVPFAFCYDLGLLSNAGWVGNSFAVFGGIGALFAMAFAMLGFIKTPIPMCNVTSLVLLPSCACGRWWR